MENHLDEVERKLGQTSSCFCLAKWLQVTIDLEHGTNHSCHHVKRHAIPLTQLSKDPSVLHNTPFKQKMRRQMLEGKRPKECGYCWNVEDAPGKNYSDRIIKSGADWAYDLAGEVGSLPWNAPVNPTYLEVMFGKECQFTCAYCMADVSSAIYHEMERFGPLPILKYSNRGADLSLRSYPAEENPFIKAFWEWWPSMIDDLRVFRITGGEPLLNRNTFKVMDSILETERPTLTLAINSNLGVPAERFNSFLERIETIVNGKRIRQFQLFTSLDTHGGHAEYVRYGLSYERISRYAESFLSRIPDAELIFMVTFNVLSFPRFQLLLQDVLSLKRRHGRRVVIDISYLQHPHYLSPKMAGPDQRESLRQCLSFMEGNLATSHPQGGFEFFEFEKLRRISGLLQQEHSLEEILDMKKDFYLFINEYDRRKNMDFLSVFPEMEKFYAECASLLHPDRPRWRQDEGAVSFSV